MAYEIYQSRHKGYEIDNLLDDVVDLKVDVNGLKTEYDANKVKMSDGTILPLHLVNTYATKTELSAKADSTQVAADIATATTDMATNTGVASAIATATTDMATNTGVASAIATATTDMATNTSVASDIATATADMATNTSVASDIATATTDMATNASVAAAIAAAAYTLPEATTSTLGGVIPDGTTITVDNDGTIHGASAIAELNDIGDVNAPSPQNDQVLTYDSATSKWIPKAGGGGGQGGHTIRNNGTAMTDESALNFTDFDISDDSTNSETDIKTHRLTASEMAEIMSESPSGGSSDGNPVGTIISFMGKTAPQGYLKCDGSVLNIESYQRLSNHILVQFGSVNYFGGDGTTTFAVPDLRGEFLRGTGTNSHSNQGSGANVGVHQDSSEVPIIGVNTTQTYTVWTDSTGHSGTSSGIMPRLGDYYIAAEGGTSGKGYQMANNSVKTLWNGSSNYSNMTVRPTNTSVLYCIKY